MPKSIAAIVVSIALLATAPAWGTVLVSDTFTYPDGNLVGQTPPIGATWAAHSGAGAKAVQVASGHITLQQSTGSGEDVNVGAAGGAALGAGGTWYAAFDLTVPAGAGTSDVVFAHFLQGSTNFTSRVWLTAPSSSGYALALSNGSSITAAGVAKTGDLAFDTTYRVVTSYDYDGMSGSIWIDPVTEASPSFAATDTVAFQDAVTAYAFRQATPATGSSTQIIDNLMVGTTFGDVVPEPATLTLLAAAGAMLWRRRR
jgi:hypothetical protein